MIDAFLTLGLAVFASVPAILQQEPERKASDVRTRDVYVSVMDKKDVPLAGLTAADFTVREDGVAREVLRAGPATAAMQVILLVDDSEALTPALQPMREGLTKFVEKLKGHAEIGIVTVGERSTSVVPSTADINALKRGITRIFARSGSGAYLLDGILEVSQGFQKRKADRPVIVAVTMEGVEFSNLQQETVLKALDASGATLPCSPSACLSSMAMKHVPQRRSSRSTTQGGASSGAGCLRLAERAASVRRPLHSTWSTTASRNCPPEKYGDRFAPRRHGPGAYEGIGTMITRRAVTLAAALTSVLSITLAAQQGRFRAGIELVSLNVTVTDGAKYVTGLEQSDFDVFEDGVKQNLSFFSHIQQPIALAILLDTSNSMEDKLATAQEAASGFVRRMKKDDVMEVIEFNSQVRIPQPFTNDVPALERAIRQTSVNGSTSLYNALYVSLKELKNERAKSSEEIRRQAIVVLSDGDDTSSVIEYEDVLELAKRSETAIYAIGLRQQETGRPKFKEAEFVLRQLSQETGGRVFFPTTIAELPKIYEQISEELASQYSMAYSSKNAMRNGAWRRIDVRVNKPGLAARSRRGYYGPRGS